MTRSITLGRAKFKLLPGCFLFFTAALLADDRVFTIEHDAGGGVSVKVGGQPFASYVIDQATKPYLWPIYGPTGKAMTRAYPMQEVDAEPAAQRDHPHHRGLGFGLSDAGGGAWKLPDEKGDAPTEETLSNGGDTWGERRTLEELLQRPKLVVMATRRLMALGRLQHRAFTQLEANATGAIVAEACDYLDAAGTRFMREDRRLTFHLIGEARAIDFDQTLIASDGDIRIGDQTDGGLYIRVPASMAVSSGLGGRIVNSAGQTDKDAWGKPAAWCDYHGPVEGEVLGVAILNHPRSFRAPTRWHVRTYGLFCADPFAQHAFDPTLPDATTTIPRGQQLSLHHRFVFHAGDEQAAGIARLYEDYARSQPLAENPAAAK